MSIVRSCLWCNLFLSPSSTLALHFCSQCVSLYSGQIHADLSFSDSLLDKNKTSASSAVCCLARKGNWACPAGEEIGTEADVQKLSSPMSFGHALFSVPSEVRPSP